MTDLHETGHVDHHIDQLVNENEIHTFILVVRLGQLTDADKTGLEWLQRVFGDKVLQFVIILFTYEREEECDTINDILKNNPVLEQLLEKCGGRYQTSNKMMNKQSEMRDLMNKIECLLDANQQQCYTGEMFNTALKQREELKNSKCGKKSDNPKNPDYVPSLFAYLSPEQRQRKINCYKKFEQTQAVKRKRCCSGDVSVSPHDYCTHMETDYSDNFPEDSRQNGNTATVKALPILSAVSYAPMKPAKQLLRN
ncbi:hypothetical protein Q8A67_007272 [Cirrhinus molitorella]|uniref:AIG1-type G domain-containing protein n=1 Tax=Cirrhinus molitorella TaxID=172907 RepID=A0AA88U226_9TELE|nr:hypothetical protein Q8A67_007272 [Cirrhinus molitorella]